MKVMVSRQSWKWLAGKTLRADQSKPRKIIGNAKFPARASTDDETSTKKEVEKGTMFRSSNDRPQLLKALEERKIPSHLKRSVSGRFGKQSDLTMGSRRWIERHPTCWISCMALVWRFRGVEKISDNQGRDTITFWVLYIQCCQAYSSPHAKGHGTGNYDLATTSKRLETSERQRGIFCR